jgi:hypothetical protein
MASGTSAGRRYAALASLVELLARLVIWREAVRTAEVDADRHVRAARLSAQELSEKFSVEPETEGFAQIASRISKCPDDPGQIVAIAAEISSVPLPLPIFSRDEPRVPLRRVNIEPRDNAQMAIAFSSFEIEGQPFAEPQTIEAEVIHDITVTVKLSRWPEGAVRVILYPLSVEPATAYDLPSFEFDHPAGEPPFVLASTGRMLVRFPVSFFARPLEFSYAARVLPEAGGTRVRVQGQRRLRVNCVDPARPSESGYSEVDKRVREVRDEARRVPAITDTELNDFLVLLNCIGTIAGQALQSNLFPGRISEADFQNEMKKLLRNNPRVGSELEEHPHAGGGITDLSFRRIRIELKVEPNRGMGISGASPFLQQTAQYVAGSDRRFGILCLLDSSEKAEAPGSVINDISFAKIDPPNGGLPICIGIVIVRGNLQRPSSL